jgi:uncharacterized membrane protein
VNEPAPQDFERLQSLNTVGTISYVLHLIVAVGALIPGGQLGPMLLIAALILDLMKRPDAAGTWHASHFRWRIRTVIIAAVLYAVTSPLWFYSSFRAGSLGVPFPSGFCTVFCPA